MSFFVSKDIESIIDKESLISENKKSSLLLKNSNNFCFEIISLKIKKNNNVTIKVLADYDVNCFLDNNVSFKIIINKHKYNVSNLTRISIKRIDEKILVKFKAQIEE